MSTNFLEVLYDLDNTTMVSEMVQKIHPFIFTQLLLLLLILYCLMKIFNLKENQAFLLKEFTNVGEEFDTQLYNLKTHVMELRCAVFVKTESENESDEEYVE